MAKKRNKLPKRIAGVKIPKPIRKGPIGRFLSSSGGQVVLAEALLAAGAYFAARRVESDTPAGEALRHPIASLRARAGAAAAPDRFARAVRAGIRAFRAELQDEAADGSTLEPDLEPGAATAPETAMESPVPRKKQSSSRGETTQREGSSASH